MRRTLHAGRLLPRDEVGGETLGVHECVGVAMRSVNAGRGWRKGIWLAILLGSNAFLAACGDDGPKQAQEPATPPRETVLEKAAKSVQQALEVRDEADTRALNSAIQQYYAEQGRYPESLKDLPYVRDRGIETGRWIYDPTAGQVRLDRGNR